jgi:hypothetical protein
MFGPITLALYIPLYGLMHDARQDSSDLQSGAVPEAT